MVKAWNDQAIYRSTTLQNPVELLLRNNVGHGSKNEKVQCYAITCMYTLINNFLAIPIILH